jgi:hypothetical protein
MTFASADHLSTSTMSLCPRGYRTAPGHPVISAGSHHVTWRVFFARALAAGTAAPGASAGARISIRFSLTGDPWQLQEAPARVSGTLLR